MGNTENFFEHIFKNAKENAIMIMNKDGIIEQVNEAFTTAYGYTNEDLHSKHFRLLYTKEDQTTLRPEIELNITHREGACSDENYLVHKDSTPVWVTGESILIKTENSTSIVKIIHNIHAQKQLERYIISSSELLDGLFQSVHSGLLILDGQLRTIKANLAFQKIFNINEPVIAGHKLQDIPHPFWSDTEVKNDLREVLVNSKQLSKEYIDDFDKAHARKLHLTVKILPGENHFEKRILVVIKPV